MKSEFHPLADQELTDAATFYEHAEPGLGAEFLDEIERLLTILEIHPNVGRPTPQYLRMAPTRRFPYSVVYQALPDHLHILAVAHHRRRPQYWAGRKDLE